MEHHESLRNSCQACQHHKNAVYRFVSTSDMQHSLTDTFEVNTGVKQSCILSPFVFMLSMDWIMLKVESVGRRGVRWTLTLQMTSA